MTFTMRFINVCMLKVCAWSLAKLNKDVITLDFYKHNTGLEKSTHPLAMASANAVGRVELLTVSNLPIHMVM